jgi:hypothetical protein
MDMFIALTTISIMLSIINMIMILVVKDKQTVNLIKTNEDVEKLKDANINMDDEIKYVNSTLSQKVNAIIDAITDKTKECDECIKLDVCSLEKYQGSCEHFVRKRGDA